MSTWRTLVERWVAPWRGGRPGADGWPTLVPPTVAPGGPPRWNDVTDDADGAEGGAAPRDAGPERSSDDDPDPRSR